MFTISDYIVIIQIIQVIILIIILKISFGFDRCKNTIGVSYTVYPGNPYPNIHSILIMMTHFSQIDHVSEIVNYFSIVQMQDVYIIFLATIANVLLLLISNGWIICIMDSKQKTE